MSLKRSFFLVSGILFFGLGSKFSFIYQEFHLFLGAGLVILFVVFKNQFREIKEIKRKERN